MEALRVSAGPSGAAGMRNERACLRPMTGPIQGLSSFGFKNLDDGGGWGVRSQISRLKRRVYRLFRIGQGQQRMKQLGHGSSLV